MKKAYVQYDHAIFASPMRAIDFATMGATALQQLCQDLYDTHFQNPLRVGVGLAAPQIGYDYNLFLIYIDKTRAEREACLPLELAFWLNAKYIAATEEKIEGREACFSVANKFYERVPRYTSVVVSGQKVNFVLDNGKITLIEVKDEVVQLQGFQARVFQHECDHSTSDNKPRFYFDYLAQGLTELQTIAAT
jgi:peptide deformylase